MVATSNPYHVGTLDRSAVLSGIVNLAANSVVRE